MEMNMHVAQNILAETELRHLAATPYQIVSPTNNSPVIGIFQDSMLGSYRFTRPNIYFNPKEAMDLLMMFPNTDLSEFRKTKISSFDILSQIIPPLTLKYKTKLFDEKENFETSNNVLEIRNGKYVRGQIEKSVMGSSTKGVIHRIFNDHGCFAAADFIDNLQNIVTEYMKTSSFSVGISDLISNKATSDRIVQTITAQKQKVQEIIDKVHLGIFENKTAKSNIDEFEIQLNNILNKATEESGKIGRESLSASNRFLMIVNSGSKGSLINISQMISCLGQTNVDAKRIPYGFDNRSLPHYSKFDDSPAARGFIENSYISGLSAPEMFFHAMGGRIGLIDTAVKSVTWETPIVIIENGEPLYTEIGRWIDSHIDGAEPAKVQHFTERQMELLNTSDIYIPTTDEDGRVSWGEITAVTRHDPGDQLYKIKTSGGRSVIVTESKSLLIWDETTKKLVETLTPDIKVGDCVPVTALLGDSPIVKTHITQENGEIIEMNYNTGEFIGKNNLPFPTEALIGTTDFIKGLYIGYFNSAASYVNSENKLCYQGLKQKVDYLNILCSRLGFFTKMFKMSNELWCIESYDDASHNFETYNDVVLDKIVEINLVDVALHPKVYDLTIPSTLNFGLANGLQVRDTAQTGYIQRRLIKGLEDLKVEYDMTVRNNKGKIIQFAYGDDGFDSTRVENQGIPLVGMSTEDIYVHYDIIGVNDQQSETLNIYTKGAASRLKKQRVDAMTKSHEYIEKMIDARTNIIESVFKNKNENTVKLPVSFQNIIANIQGQMELNAHTIVDITPLETFQLVEEYFGKLNKIHFIKPTPLFEIMYYFYLTPRELLVTKRFHRKALILLLETIVLKYKQAIVHPGEMVGVIAGQAVGEPSTQLTLNSVTYETEILVRNRDGEISKVQIGEFTERGIKTSPKIEFIAEKNTTYAELKDYYEIPSANESGETVWRRIEAVTQHPVINEDGTNTMLKVTTKGCREVIVTKAKSLLKLIDGKILGVNGSELKIGDYLPCSRKPLEYTPIHVLDLKTILPPSEYIYTSELEKAREVMHEHHWWSKYQGKKFTLPYARGDSACIVVKNKKPRNENPIEHKPGMVYTKSNNICNYLIPEKIELDYDFGYFVGAYAAEGCMTKHQLSIANNDLEFFKPIKRVCEKYNLTTKIYVHENKCQEGWTSTDMRIYSTLMCRILDKLCGKLSHGKNVSDKIVFSNPDCIRGFLDAYISGDGSVSEKSKNITVHSVSYNLLLAVQIMCKNVGAIGKITKQKKQTHNNRGTKPENFQQPYVISFRNKNFLKLASVLNLSIKKKQDTIEKLKKYDFNYTRIKPDIFPNCINGEIVFEERNGRMMDLEFDEVVSIEEIANTTDFAYDLTVEDTRNFDCYNAVNLIDTFHSSGISSKSNVTRGVPRIEEILRLTKNPKNPSLTVFLKPVDELQQEKATKYANMLEHTKLIDVVKSVQIYFDPNDEATTIPEDKMLIEQYYEFEKLIQDCQQEEPQPKSKSKWIIRMEIDAETLLDKNITMDDIHFAITSVHSYNISCVYSDYNASNLVFRIRLDSSVFYKSKKKGIPETLDQSDEIYLLRNFQETLLNYIVLRGVQGIRSVNARKVQNYVVKDEGKYARKDVWVLDTTGTNLMEVMAIDYIDASRTYSNNIKEVFDVLGIEAARQNLYNEFFDVMEFSDVYINYHHLSLLCDRMSLTSNMVPIFRSGILNDDIGPISKATFEVHTEVLLDAARHANFDHARGVSASVMLGQLGNYGTGAFQLLLDMEKMRNVEDVEVDTGIPKEKIEEMFGVLEDGRSKCSKQNIEIKNNLAGIRPKDTNEVCDDDYNMGF
jgi:DNA-directed RNA polymerase beta' subunit